jgi:hypothetical protein
MALLHTEDIALPLPPLRRAHVRVRGVIAILHRLSPQGQFACRICLLCWSCLT